jgi:prepilin-type N-terminal cleavage/methylation domain-containing protein
MFSMSRTCFRSSRRAGVTLLEITTVIVIIGILAVLLYPAMGWYGERSRRVACTQNLKGLYSATSSYLNSNGGVWPQIPWNSGDPQAYARAWYNVLHPYGLAWVNFICPSVQRKIGNPDFNQPKFNRSDYRPTFFDNRPWTARKWSRQPWFYESQSMHGSGQLLIFTDGTIMDLKEAKKLGAEPVTP